MLQSRLDKDYSKFDGACNPESPSHWLKEFIDNKEIDAYIQHYTIFDNPHLPKEFVENLCKEYEGTVFYGRYIEGLWTLAEGLIYPMHDKAMESKPDDARVTDYCLSVDYGTMNAFAALLWEKCAGVWYCTKGYYYSGRDTGIQKTDGEYADALDALVEDAIKDMNGERGLSRFGQVLSKIETIIDPSAASFITLLAKRKFYKVRKANNDVLDGIRETALAMQRGLIKINPNLDYVKEELQGYVWDDDSADDRPLKVNDHACDAIRYFVKTKKLVREKRSFPGVGIYGGH